jgi:hypothetical protein
MIFCQKLLHEMAKMSKKKDFFYFFEKKSGEKWWIVGKNA